VAQSDTPAVRFLLRAHRQSPRQRASVRPFRAHANNYSASKLKRSAPSAVLWLLRPDRSEEVFRTGVDQIGASRKWTRLADTPSRKWRVCTGPGAHFFEKRRFGLQTVYKRYSTSIHRGVQRSEKYTLRRKALRLCGIALLKCIPLMLACRLFVTSRAALHLR
jgi:hypothetical protein